MWVGGWVGGWVSGGGGEGVGASRYGHHVRMPDVVHHLGLRNDAADPDNGNLSASPGEWCLLGGRCVQTVWRRRAVEFAREAIALLAKICTEFTKHVMAVHVQVLVSVSNNWRWIYNVAVKILSGKSSGSSRCSQCAKVWLQIRKIYLAASPSLPQSP